MVTVSFRDLTGLSLTAEHIRLEKILEAAALPEGHIVIVLNDCQVDANAYGICVAQRLSRWYQGGVDFDDLATDWDCGVALSLKTCRFFEKYPALFTYYLGHELGHALLCLENVEHSLFCDLVRRHIRGASKNAIELEYKVPHEAACDEFGVMIADRIFPRARLDSEIESRLKEEDCNDKKRLQFIGQLPGTRRVSSIYLDMVRFSLPYKDALISSWKEIAEKDPDSIEAKCINDPEACFHLPSS